MLTWIDPPETNLPADFREAVGGHPIIAQILSRRGITSPVAALAHMDPHRYTPASPEDFPGMQEACLRIEQAIDRRQRVWVWGDFDVDGQTSTALLVSVLRSLGLQPGFHIPVRAQESHGVNIAHLQPILDAGAELVITCDTGITAHEALAYARDRKVDVIVTDHHALGESLPPALACITPRLLPPGHPLAGLPGVGVAFKLAEALLQRRGRGAETARLLDLAALGIVADVAQQTGDTRYLLQLGLEVLRNAGRVGLKTIMELAEVNPANLTEEHIGFAIGPRLNALGRLDDANPAVELLTTEDPQRARVLALQLEGLNARRQLLTRQVLQAAVAQIEREPALLDSAALVLAHPDWPAGVIGIAASALVERYQRPAILLSSPAGQPARGSARSIEGVDITACIAQAQDLLLSYGGHPMAAGMALDPANLPAFRRTLSRAVSAQIQAAGGQRERVLQLDGVLRLDELSLELVEDLERLAPFGAGNPSPVFAIRDLAISSSAAIGREREHLLLNLEDRAGNVQKALWWGGTAWPQPDGRFDLACSLRASDFRGQREVQVEWVNFRPIAAESIQLESASLQIIDQRTAAHPRQVLEALRAEGDLAIWAEGAARQKLNGQERTRLSRATRLAIWTAPPGRQELLAALNQVNPQVVILFGLEPETADAQGFLSRLSGLAKYLLNPSNPQPAKIELARLAGETAQSEAAVRFGLQWLAAQGHLTFTLDEDGSLLLSPGTGQTGADGEAWLGKVRSVLDEAAAFRRFFAATDSDLLGLSVK